MEILTANKYRYVKYKGLKISLSSINGVKLSTDGGIYLVNLSVSGNYKAIGTSKTLEGGLELYYQAFKKAESEGLNPTEFKLNKKCRLEHV